MKTKILLLLVVSLIFNCSNTVEYSEAFKKETAGSYLYNPDELLDVYYKNDKLYLIWKGGTIEPVALKQNEFFVPDMYAKLRFVTHPETNKRYLSILPEDNKDTITYDYLKVPEGYKTPSTLLEEGAYDKALAGFLEIKAQDSTSSYINERNFNRKGYQLMSKNEYKKAIEVFKLNVALHPNSSNVYDSLAQAYLVSGDSLQAYSNYKKTLEINSENKRAKSYVNTYKLK